MRHGAKEIISDQEKDAAMLKVASPLANAAKIKAPVLMTYGGVDRRVRIIHSGKVRDALKTQGTPVEWVVYPDEGHGFLLDANRSDFHGGSRKFLGQNLESK
jgi:dipeptidyl aminopeptidase/acylaminoacyl peptidase